MVAGPIEGMAQSQPEDDSEQTPTTIALDALDRQQTKVNGHRPITKYR